MTRTIKTTFFALASLAALMLTCLAPSAFAAFPTVGSPSDHSGPNLVSAIMAVYNSGAKGVTIHPGQYTLSQPNSNDTTQIE